MSGVSSGSRFRSHGLTGNFPPNASLKWSFYNFRSNYSPFAYPVHHPALASFGFRQTDVYKADLIFCRNLRHARLVARLFPRKQAVVWTNEPAFDASTDLHVSAWPGKPILVCNVFTGHVFWHNRHFLGSYHYDSRIDLGLELKPIDFGCASPNSFKRRQRALAVFARKKVSASPFSQAQSIDLNPIRQDLAFRGHQLDQCDIVGSGWDGLALEASGFEVQQNEPWWTRKLSLLQNYRFSIALENTATPYYVTEKIWHAVKAGALPVYWSKNSTIFESFPSESFVDAAAFRDFDALWTYLRTMGSAEWCERIRRCAEAYNRAVEQRLLDGSSLTEVIRRFLALL